MYSNLGYLNNSLIDFMDKSKPLIVGSCGTYRLISKPRLPTWRPKGRLDYQLLYVAAGKGYFCFNGKEEIVTAGHMVLYRPKESQKYTYYGINQTEVYWVHFTGSDVAKILREYGIPLDKHVIYTGNSPDYHRIFRNMIQEMQLHKPHFEDYLTMLLREIFILAGRQLTETRIQNPQTRADIEEATQYFNKNFNQNINIEEYAVSKHMSTCWFIRNFKQYNHMTPMQYILSLRIANAQSLLTSSSSNVTEVAAAVGYDNPLYFSRLFKKQIGLAPSEFKKLNLSSEEILQK